MLHKSVILIMVLMLETMAMSVKQRYVTYTTTSTTFVGLSQSWYLSAYHEGVYWGLYAKKKTTTIQGVAADLLDTLGVASYYNMSGGAYLALWTAGANFQNDVDSVKSYLNIQWTLHPGTRAQGLFPVGVPDSRRDTVNSYLQIFKLDSICAAIAIPNSNTIKIYKNYLGNWSLKATITTTSTATLLTFTCKNSQAYFTSNNDLYKISNNCNTTEKIQSNVIGYFPDNQGLWLTSSSGLSYLKDGTRTDIRSGSKYACKFFAVNPIDTTFFYGNRLENSTYGDTAYMQFPISFPVNLTVDGSITDYIYSFFKKGNYLNVCRFPRANRDLIVNEATQEITYQIEGNITIYKFNYTPFFYNTEFVDSLYQLNESGHIVYQDTIHAFDYSLNEQLTYSIITNPIGATLSDSILSINTNLPAGNYNIKFQVKDRFSVTAYDTITWVLKICTGKISIQKNVATTASEGNLYSQNLITTDPDDDSSYVRFSRLPSWLTLTRTSKNQFNIAGTPTHSTADTSIMLIVTDSSYHYDAVQKQNTTATFDTLTYNIRITLTNDTPVIVEFGAWDTTYVNQLYTCQVQAIDEQPLTYTILLGPVSISPTGLISCSPTNIGSYMITFQVTDAYGLSCSHNYMLVVKYPNRSPTLMSVTNDTTITETDSLTLTAVASDSDGTIPDVRWYSGETLLAQNNSYKIKTDYSSAGTRTYKVVVSDGEFNVEKTVTLIVLDKNRLPSIPKDTTITIHQLNTPFSISVKAIDPDGDKLIYSFDPTAFNVSNLVVEIKDSIYKVSLKKNVSDTLTFIISDGKSQVTFSVRVIADIPTSILPTIKILKNSFTITHGIAKYTVAKQDNVMLFIYSIDGRTIYKFNRMSNSGSYVLPMNLTSGTYIYKFTIGKDFATTNKMQIVR